jgi:hypothetical protein
VTWPDGRVESLPRTAADQTITIKQGSGIVRSTPVQRTP